MREYLGRYNRRYGPFVFSFIFFSIYYDFVEDSRTIPIVMKMQDNIYMYMSMETVG